MYVLVFMALPVMVASKLTLVDGYSQLHHNSIAALKLLLILVCCVQSGVLTFKQCLCYLVYWLSVSSVFFSTTFADYVALRRKESLPVQGHAIAIYIVFIVLSGIFVLLTYWVHMKSEVAAFNNVNLGADTTLKIRKFVDRLLPKHVQDYVASDELVGETAEDVTLLFADIVGFTSYSAGKTPQEVVQMLSQLFTAFDKECNRLNLYKLYTIGDCYVVMSFLDKNNRLSPEKECVDVIELALKMIDIISRVREEIGFDGLHMRIGVHTGKIIGGVIGTGIVRYDMYGQDVLIANKIESSGKSDAVHISEATKLMIDKSANKRRYEFDADDDIVVKSLGKTVKTYFVEKRGRKMADTDREEQNRSHLQPAPTGF